MTTQKSELRWYDAYPTVKSQNTAALSCSDFLRMIRSGAVSGKDFLLVDLRRDDHVGGTIRGSLNLPAQTLYPSLPTVYTLAKAAKIPRVIWYCGSSRGRGTRAAGWFQDLLVEKDDNDVSSLVLVDGIAGWANGGTEYTSLIDEYDAEAWHKK